MKTNAWLIFKKVGTMEVRKQKPRLEWNELAMQVNVEIPDALFDRPTLEAHITVQDIPNTANDAQVIVNTAELIEQQTGAKINFTVTHDPKSETPV